MKNLLSDNKISLVACGLILSSSMMFAADTINSAFKDGKASGSLALYGEKHDYKDGVKDSGFGNGQATVAFETASFYGFNAKAEFKGNLGLGEIEKYDRDGGTDSAFANNSLMTEAYLKYAMEGFSVTAGRQAIDLEWLADYNEAVVAAITVIPDTTVVLGYTQRKAESGIDLSEDFHDINGNKGVYVLDVKYAGLESVEFNPYVYSAPDAVDFYGLKTTITTDYFGVIAHYAENSVDKNFGAANGYEDGSIGHLELNTTVADISAAVGYIKTDKDGGAAIMTIAGDNISPFDTGNRTYDPDARTIYGSLGYTVLDVELGALYGVTTYGTNDSKEKELNLTASYPITESLTAAILYGDVNEDSADVDFKDDKYVLASVEYTF
ncbi:MAG: Opr family porin [Arcobacteraceae bacterium]